MKEKLLQIINHYGVMPQLKYFQSEVYELNEAIIQYETLYNNDSTMKQLEACKNHIGEEIGDVLNMIEEFMLYYEIKIEDIIETKHKKIDRQLDRIEKEGC